MEYEKAYRQGEILIFKVKEKPRPNSLFKRISTGVIREGEKAGHEHKVTGGQTQLDLSPDGDEGTLSVKKEAEITHPEHDPIKLPKGEYVVKVQKEATGKNKSQSVKD